MLRVTHPGRARAARALAAAGLSCLAAGLALAPAAASPAAAGTAAAHSSARAAAVTVRGPRLYNPASGGLLPRRSTVTVSQDASLSEQEVQVSWANFTPTSPPLTPYSISANLEYTVMVAECRGTRPVRWQQCYGADQGGITGGQGTDGDYNTGYAVTGANGTGQVGVALYTTALGCDQAHPCSLVIVPGQGGNETSPGTGFQCSNHVNDYVYAQPTSTFTPAYGYCSWNDKIVIPLHFSASTRPCPIQNNVAFTAAGGPLASRVMQQWQAGLCRGKHPLPVAYLQSVQEPLAVTEASASQVALTTRPASVDKLTANPADHFVYAPIAVSAVSVAYWLDNTQNLLPFTRMRLDQRLVAKLITTSYNFAGSACGAGPSPPCDRYVEGDQTDLTSDPEFEKLNPQMTGKTFSQSFEIPTVQYGRSDMTWTLTRWVAADPAAAAFLRGQREPDGEHIDAAYLHLKYPTDQFAVRDRFYSNPNSPSDYQYLPVSPPQKVALDQALNQNAGIVGCLKGAQNCTPSADPPEAVGQRALLAIADQASAAAYDFPVAALRNAAGNYVTPTNASMAAAVAHMTSDGSGTLQVNQASKDPRAYPLTMVIYAMVPTAGASHAQAAAIARFLDFAAGPGQQPGPGPGQLPPGCLPLPASLRAETRRDAIAVADQSGGKPGKSPSGHTTGSGSGSGSASPSASSGAGSGLTSSPSATASPRPSVTLPGPTASQRITTQALANPDQSAFTRYVLPVLLLLGGLAALAGVTILSGSAWGPAVALRRWLRGGA